MRKPHILKLTYIFSLILYTIFSSRTFAEEVRSILWEDLTGLNYNTGKMNSQVRSLNGKTIRIPGFMIPLEDGSEEISEFLLVPQPMMCIHVPAPPPNQVIHVTMQKGKKVPITWPEPIWMYGIIRVKSTSSEYAQTAYVMEGMKTETYQGDYDPYGPDPTE